MTTRAVRALDENNSKFSFNATPKFSMDASAPAGKQRRFEGVAYSGEVIPAHYFWDDVIFDMSTMSLPEKLPALVDHNRGMRAGYTTQHSLDPSAGFMVSGNLLSNESGAAVAKDSDEGFPWQMSIDISPGSVEEVSAGTAVTVNGKVYAGPLTVFRNSRISEVSFTATGWDSKTSATAMSRGGGANATVTQPASTGDTMTEAEKLQLETLQKDNATLQATLATAQGEVTKFQKASREADVKLLCADTGIEYKADDETIKDLHAMDATAFSLTAKTLRTKFSKPAGTGAAAGVDGQPLPNALTQHFASKGTADRVDTNGQPATGKNTSLVDMARARAEKFNKQRSA